MRILRTLAFWLATIVAVGLVYLLVADPHFSASFSQTEVQQRINAKLPFTSPPKKGMTFTVHQGATVEFRPDGRVGVKGRFEGKPTFTKTSHYEGDLVASAELVFRNGAFYLGEPKVESLNGKVVLSERAEIAKSKILGLKNRLEQAIGITPDEERKLFNPEGLKAKALDWMVAKFAKVPVYKLDGKQWWHWMANSALDKVEVQGQTVTVTLSLSKLALSIIMSVALMIAAVAVVFGVIMSGGEGLGALLFFGMLS